jgi:hypothetical protein
VKKSAPQPSRSQGSSEAPVPRHFIEVAHLINGELISARRLSPLDEWRQALAAAGLVLAATIGSAVVVGVALLAARRVIYGPGYVALWLAIGVGASALAAARARGRARQYTIGAGIDDDAFAGTPMALVRRGPSGYELALTQGMTGHFDGGRSPVLVESLVQARDARLPLGPGARAEVSLGATTFVVRAVLAGACAVPEGAAQASFGRGFARRTARRALMPLQMATLASGFCVVPAGARLSENDMKSAIPANATPWEIEKMLRAEAQTQARSLHECFDVLPLECQRSGYVGVGLSLSREGEIRSRWIARSTFGQDCPVEQCMSDVISTWFFEPLPEAIKVVLPVQVLRTDKPMPHGAARAAANLARRAAARNGVN